jgi:hypothetical protein
MSLLLLKHLLRRGYRFVAKTNKKRTCPGGATRRSTKKAEKPLYALFLRSDMVTASGFKPETFSSVVRCSIQLSYAAIPFWDCKDR